MKNKKLIIIISIIVISIILLFAFTSTNPIVGTWEGTVLNMKTVYVFNKDGTYESFLQSTVADGTYGTYSVNDKTLVLSSSDGKSREIRYSLHDNTLILTAKLGDKDVDTILTRTD